MSRRIHKKQKRARPNTPKTIKPVDKSKGVIRGLRNPVKEGIGLRVPVGCPRQLSALTHEYSEERPSSREDWRRMADLCRTEIAAGGAELSLYNNLGVALLELGELNEAESALLNATRCVNAGAKEFFNLGLVYSAQGRKSEARDTYKHAVTLDPSHFEGLVNLGNLLSQLRDSEGALEIYRRAQKLRPIDPSVNFMVAALEGSFVARPPLEHVRRLFDQYAPEFEQHLLDKLDYQGPSALRRMVDRHLTDDERDMSVLDLGCGTGLIGKAFADRCDQLIGVDLAPKMIEKAREKGCYNELHTVDMLLFLQQTKLRFTLFLAADTFIYVGDLRPIFTGMKRCANAGAIAAFSVERSSTAKEIQLNPTGRYAHSLEYIFSIATETGWQLLDDDPFVIRKHQGCNVDGSIVAMRFSG